jgi:hypothetical protein
MAHAKNLASVPVPKNIVSEAMQKPRDIVHPWNGRKEGKRKRERRREGGGLGRREEGKKGERQEEKEMELD